MKNKFKQPLLHILICMACLMVPLIFEGPRIQNISYFPFNTRDVFTMIMYSVMIVFWYFNFYYLIPKFYISKQFTRYIIILATILTVILTIDFIGDYQSMMHDPRMPHPHESFEHFRPPHIDMHDEFHHPKPMFHRPMLFPHLSQLLFLYIIGVFVSLYIQLRRNMEIIEQEKNHAELSYLKSQINPHFLFNTFNSIYALAIKENAERTADGMLKLSGMMRYVVTETSSEFVPLEKEINYINDFIELQRLRLDKSVKLDYVCSGSTDEKRISPLLLIPFIENAFKHGVNPDENSVIRIHLTLHEKDLQLEVANNKVSIDQSTNEKMGFGIENTRNRLQRMYPGLHTLDIIDSTTEYKVYLKLTLI